MLVTLLKLLVMLLATNGAPVIAARIFRSYGELPVDLGKRLRDGNRLFGASKTWRGIFAALSTSLLLAILFGYGAEFGFIFGTLVMTGDLCSSFIKRRQGLGSGARSVGWDQVPESLLPSSYAVYVLALNWWWALVLTLTFTLVQMLISRPLHWLHIRKNPH